MGGVVNSVTNAVGGLFGGSSSGAGAQQSSSSSSSALDPEIKRRFLANLDRATNVANNLGVQQFAPRTGDYNAGQAMVRNAATNGLGLQAMGGALGLTGGNATASSMDRISSYLNPYADYVAGNTLNALGRANQIALNGVAGDATKAGAWGGSRSGVAQAETNRNFADIAGQTIGNIYNQGFNTALGASQADLNRQLSAANQLSSLGNAQQQAQYQAGQNVMNLGLADQQFSQQQLDAIRNLPLEQQQIINQALSINPGGGSGIVSSGTQQGTTQGQGLLGNAQGIGSLLGGAGMAYLAFSDENLKDNIESVKDPLGKLRALDGKTYSYKAKGTPSLGLIAQDVEDVMPDAVVDTPAGKAMSYPAVTGLLVSAVNELSDKIEKKGAKHGRTA